MFHRKSIIDVFTTEENHAERAQALDTLLTKMDDAAAMSDQVPPAPLAHLVGLSDVSLFTGPVISTYGC